VIDHDGVGIFDLSDQVRFLHRIERDNISNVLEHVAFEVQGLDNQIGDDNFPAAFCH